ncbi:MAG: hypothetical protein WCG23_10325 [bacterium]
MSNGQVSFVETKGLKIQERIKIISNQTNVSFFAENTETPKLNLLSSIIKLDNDSMLHKNKSGSIFSNSELKTSALLI